MTSRAAAGGAVGKGGHRRSAAFAAGLELKREFAAGDLVPAENSIQAGQTPHVVECHP
ncbi:hypothetical protein [Micromonospora sp. IBHARD004]|uniref:hypothetical protein n=1 Tax=Micromonospora sp. IBHARD004 TaxID=3457764 RepID=UPI0040588528